MPGIADSLARSRLQSITEYSTLQKMLQERKDRERQVDLERLGAVGQFLANGRNWIGKQEKDMEPFARQFNEIAAKHKLPPMQNLVDPRESQVDGLLAEMALDRNRYVSESAYIAALTSAAIGVMGSRSDAEQFALKRLMEKKLQQREQQASSTGQPTTAPAPAAPAAPAEKKPAPAPPAEKDLSGGTLDIPKTETGEATAAEEAPSELKSAVAELFQEDGETPSSATGNESQLGGLEQYIAEFAKMTAPVKTIAEKKFDLDEATKSIRRNVWYTGMNDGDIARNVRRLAQMHMDMGKERESALEDALAAIVPTPNEVSDVRKIFLSNPEEYPEFERVLATMSLLLAGKPVTEENVQSYSRTAHVGGQWIVKQRKTFEGVATSALSSTNTRNEDGGYYYGYDRGETYRRKVGRLMAAAGFTDLTKEQQDKVNDTVRELNAEDHRNYQEDKSRRAEQIAQEAAARAEGRENRIAAHQEAVSAGTDYNDKFRLPLSKLEGTHDALLKEYAAAKAMSITKLVKNPDPKKKNYINVVDSGLKKKRKLLLADIKKRIADNQAQYRNLEREALAAGGETPSTPNIAVVPGAKNTVPTKADLKKLLGLP